MINIQWSILHIEFAGTLNRSCYIIVVYRFLNGQEYANAENKHPL